MTDDKLKWREPLTAPPEKEGLYLGLYGTSKHNIDAFVLGPGISIPWGLTKICGPLPVDIPSEALPESPFAQDLREVLKRLQAGDPIVRACIRVRPPYLHSVVDLIAEAAGIASDEPFSSPRTLRSLQGEEAVNAVARALTRLLDRRAG